MVFGIFEQMLRLKWSWPSSHHSRPHPHISCTITGIHIKRDPGVLLQVDSLAAMACRCNGYGCTSVVSSAQQSSSPSGTRLKLGHTKYPARNCRSFRTSSNTATNATDFLGIRKSERHPASPPEIESSPTNACRPTHVLRMSPDVLTFLPKAKLDRTGPFPTLWPRLLRKDKSKEPVDANVPTKQRSTAWWDTGITAIDLGLRAWGRHL